MATSRTVKRTRKRHHMTPGQKLLFIVALLAVFAVCSTVFFDLNSMEEAYEPAVDSSDWPDPVHAYVLAQEGSLTATFYNEGLAPVGEYGRGTEIELENWEPFKAENGEEYYHAYLDGHMGYIPCQNVTDDQSALLQEAQLYVRSTVNMLQESNDILIGPLAQKGTLLRIVGYDYFRPDGTVNMYHVMMGEEFGWIKSEYVALDYGEAMSNWNNDKDSYGDHVFRGDDYGGGDAGALDYWPHEKGDFSDEGNVMPVDTYALYITADQVNPNTVSQYLDLAKDTQINAFVVTLMENFQLAYPSPWLKQAELLDDYTVTGTLDEAKEAIQMLKDAGYYVIGRLTTFQDSALATARPDWSITDWGGQLMQMSESFWPSPFCRDVWQVKVAFAAEAVDTFDLNEVQFDYVRFPDYIQNYENEGTVDLKNAGNESKAQALQRFLTYATDVIHSHGAYVAADMFGETGNYYVAPYGQYWPAISNVVDVVCGMPYPDHFGTYYENNDRIVPYKRPYKSTNDWAIKVSDRQTECGSPAVVRTWIQTWDDYGYEYDSLNIIRQIVALYDADITGGYMLWHGNGSLFVSGKLPEVLQYDFLSLYEKSEQANQLLSDYMNIKTEDDG